MTKAFTPPTPESLRANPDFDLTLAIAAAKLNISCLDALERFSTNFNSDAELKAAFMAAEREQYPLHIYFQQSQMSELTTDPVDPRLGRGSDTEPTKQNEVYLVLSDDEIAKGFVRPLRRTYKHATCDTTTTMSQKIAETYARDPSFYGATYCVHCQMHRPLNEFTWLDDGSGVGT